MLSSLKTRNYFPIVTTSSPGGRDCFSLFALFWSSTHRVYRYLLHRTLNLVFVPVFLIFTDRASLRRAVRRKSLISLICLGCWNGGGVSVWMRRMWDGRHVVFVSRHHESL